MGNNFNRLELGVLLLCCAKALKPSNGIEQRNKSDRRLSGQWTASFLYRRAAVRHTVVH